MGPVVLVLVIWLIAVGAWLVVSKYAKSADVQKVKDRLMGTSKSKKSGKKASPEETSIIQETGKAPSRLAQLVVDKYKLAPKIQEMLEQAGLRWQPARLVHLCLLSFG